VPRFVAVFIDAMDRPLEFENQYRRFFQKSCSGDKKELYKIKG
jgi:hypothetical protein